MRRTIMVIMIVRYMVKEITTFVRQITNKGAMLGRWSSRGFEVDLLKRHKPYEV